MLTATNVARFQPPATEKFIWHPDGRHGFGVRVYKSGRKVWGITRRWGGHRNPIFRRIGDYPALKLAAARELAAKIVANPENVDALIAAAAGAPIPEAKPAPTEPPTATFGAMIEQFLGHGRSKRGRELRATTMKGYRRALQVYSIALRDRPVRSIRRGEIAAVLRATATAHGTTTAMHTRRALSRLWSWLLANDLVDANVVAGTEGFDIPKRSRVLSDGELAAIWQATAGSGDFNLIVRVLLWTGARRAEVGGMGWSELSDGVWSVPGSRVKNHRALVLPLAQPALAAIQGHARWVGRDNVFGRGPNGFGGWSQAKARLDRQLGFAQPWDLHDLRRTVQTRLIGLGVSRDLVNKILNHAMNPIDAAYDQHDYVIEKRAALAAWAAELDRIVTSGAAKVIALR